MRLSLIFTAFDLVPGLVTLALMSDPSSDTQRRDPFVTTHWSVVLAAGLGDSTAVREALESLCRIYWPPLFFYIRRRGYSPEDAEDLTQAFFATILERNDIASLDPLQGKFRAFLLAALNHFLSSAWDRESALKRGGGDKPLSLDAAQAEHCYQMEPADTMTPDKLFDLRWAYTVLERAAARLAEEHSAGERRALYERLKGCLAGGKPEQAYDVIGKELGLSESAVKAASFQLRKRYRTLVRDEVAQTVGTVTQIDEEIRDLIAIVRG